MRGGPDREHGGSEGGQAIGTRALELGWGGRGLKSRAQHPLRQDQRQAIRWWNLRYIGQVGPHGGLDQIKNPDAPAATRVIK